MKLAVHAFEPRSRANGPGVRAVLWVQGCTLACPGCYNPDTHASGLAGTEVAELADQIAAITGIEGLSISGGEPLQQPEAVLALIRAVRTRAPSLSILLFSGYTLAEIRAIPAGPALLAELDVLIDGRYRAADRRAHGLRGSANQHIHLLSERYTLADVEATPEAEIRIDPTGAVVLTGVNPLKLKGRS